MNERVKWIRNIERERDRERERERERRPLLGQPLSYRQEKKMEREGRIEFE